jgi:hypothetical protein
MNKIIKKFKTFIRIIKEEGLKGGFKKSTKIILKKILKQETEQKIFNIILKIRGKISNKVINKPFEVVWVPTELIKFDDTVTFKPYNKKKLQIWEKIRWQNLINNEIRKVGIISTIDFDQNIFNNNILKIFEDRYNKKKEWSKTSYYKYFFNNNWLRNYRKVNNWQEFKDKVLFEYDKIFESIKKNGYKTQKEINGKSNNEVEVAILRKGEILFIDGRHRLSIAIILGIKKIPVIVNVWHKEYIDWIRNNTNIKNITPKTAIQPIIENHIK